jgi:hypothetical protein
MAIYLVLDTMTHRVIQYSENEFSQQGKNTYWGQVLELPEGLNEKNSWQYKFAGGALKHAPTSKVEVVGAAAVLRETKAALRRTVMDKAQHEFGRKIPLTALTYIASLDASRKWVSGQQLEPIEQLFISSREKAEDFLKLHYANLERAFKVHGPMDKKLRAITKAATAAELEKIIP